MAKSKKSMAVTSRKAKVNKTKQPQGLLSSVAFARAYVLLSLVILLVTTFLWSLLSAKVQQGNSDQLINSFLFEHIKTAHGALIPGQHTLLLKWPIFILIGLFGTTASTIKFFTVGLVLITVAALVVLLHKIEKRPLVFGTLCLALASVLLMVPAEPYAGGLLPVNMAMLSTRNIEYIFYIIGLVLFIKSARIRSWKFSLGVVVMTLLFASDKLFLTISLVGAMIALVCYALAQSWKLVNLSVNWLIGTLISTVGAEIVLWIIKATGITHIVNAPSLSPYNLVNSAHDFILGCFYAVVGIFTNLGANPASNYTIVRHIPSQVFDGLKSLGGIAFIINAVVLVTGLYLIYRLIRASVVKVNHASRLSVSLSLSIMLIWSTVAAIGIFIVTNHAFAVDARYLTIALFSVFVSIAVYLRSKAWQSRKTVICGLIIVIGIVLGLFSMVHTYNNEVSALSAVNQQDTTIAEVMDDHPVNVLVGNYWQVIPTKLLISNKNVTELPLLNCTQTVDTLTSTAWQVNLHHSSFAYLLSLDQGLTNYPNCTIKQTLANYGRPNQSDLISGTLSQPKELLLVYDHGIVKHKAKKATTPTSSEPATILPISLSDLSNTICSNPTIMNVVAHEDDDLLFMNPDLMHSISGGDCVRTVYVTAGNSGEGEYYWLNRQEGVEAAYSYMSNSEPVWVQKIVMVASHEYITVANPESNSRISLIFMHLPDGNLKGQGFKDNNFQSLAKLESGSIKVINSVDGQSYYSSAQLVAALTSLLHIYQPAQIRTQANYVSAQFPDHSDHIAVGNYVRLAYAQYEQQQYSNQVTIPISYYVGYPIHGDPANVTGADLKEKEAAFLIYAKYDDAVCQTLQSCLQTPTYNSYLTREYQYKS